MKPEQMTVLLTGANGGIGSALALELARAGASLYLTDRDQNRLDQLADKLRDFAGEGQFIEAHALDLLNDAQVDAWIDSMDASRPINVLINNAGISPFGMFERQSERDIELTMMLNTIVPMKMARRLLPMLKKQAKARIINIASTFGALGFPGYSVYSASKYSIRGFSEALSRELADTNVSVGCFLPRATQTAINTSSVIEMNRAMKVTMDSPQTVARALLAFVASKRTQQAYGWPEKILVRINALFPTLVSNGLRKKLPLIKRFAAA
jgi:short-subunit dehydrogenase